MYKLLIVDDDPWMRELLERIEWQRLGFEKVMTAANGLLALQQIEADPPHILLTDIKMDGLNGIELLIAVREKYPDIRVVLLSEYNEFEYARVAVKKGVVDYLLKPIEEKELTALVQRTLKVIEQEQSNRARDRKIMAQLEHSLPLLQEKFIKDLISGNGGDPNSFYPFADSHRTIDFTAFYILIIETDKGGGNTGPENGTGKNRMPELKKLVEVFLNQLGRMIGFYENNQLVVIFTPEYAEVERDLRLLQEKIGNDLGISVSIGLSKLHDNQPSVFQAYLESLQALKRKFYLGKGLIALAGAGEDFHSTDFMEVVPREKLYNSLVSGNDEKVFAAIAEYCQKIRERRISYPCLRVLHLRIMEILYEALEKSNIRRDDAQTLLFAADPDGGLKLDAFETLEDLRDWLSAVFGKGTDLINGKGGRHIRKIADDAVRYIQEHLHENISLDVVAKKLYLNPAYLSRLFKDEVGKTFTHYLMKARIEKAKELLKDTYLKVYEISERVGYGNWKYFCRIFKDFEGVTPNEYRDKIPKSDMK